MIDLLVMALAAGLLAPVAASAQEGPAARSAKERARDRKRAAKSLVILRDAWNEDGDDLGLRWLVAQAVGAPRRGKRPATPSSEQRRLLEIMAVDFERFTSNEQAVGAEDAFAASVLAWHGNARARAYLHDLLDRDHPGARAWCRDVAARGLFGIGESEAPLAWARARGYGLEESEVIGSIGSTESDLHVLARCARSLFQFRALARFGRNNPRYATRVEQVLRALVEQPYNEGSRLENLAAILMITPDVDAEHQVKQFLAALEKRIGADPGERPVMLDCDWTYALIHGVGVANTLSEIGDPAGRRFLFAVVRHLYPDSHTTAIRPHRGPWRMAVARLQEDDDAESNEVLRGAARRLLALEEELRALWAFDAVALLGEVGELGDLERLDDLLAGEEPRVRVAAAAACLRILARG